MRELTIFLISIIWNKRCFLCTKWIEHILIIFRVSLNSIYMVHTADMMKWMCLKNQCLILRKTRPHQIWIIWIHIRLQLPRCGSSIISLLKSLLKVVIDYRPVTLVFFLCLFVCCISLKCPHSITLHVYLWNF